jgi:hypothetical protein
MNNSEILDDLTPKKTGVQFKYPALICSLSVLFYFLFRITGLRYFPIKIVSLVIITFLFSLFIYGYVGLIKNAFKESLSLLQTLALLFFSVMIFFELVVFLSMWVNAIMSLINN